MKNQKECSCATTQIDEQICKETGLTKEEIINIYKHTLKILCGLLGLREKHGWEVDLVDKQAFLEYGTLFSIATCDEELLTSKERLMQRLGDGRMIAFELQRMIANDSWAKENMRVEMLDDGTVQLWTKFGNIEGGIEFRWREEDFGLAG